MSLTCQHWDLRREVRTAAETAIWLDSQGLPLLISSSHPLPLDWPPAYSLCLLDGPSLFQRLYLPHPPRLASLEWARERQRHWLLSFKTLAQSARQGQIPESEGLSQDILELLTWEEQKIFPRVNAFLGCSRACRALGYEHLGIRRLLPSLGPVLASLPEQSSSQQQKSWERFSLDLVHLVEHHLEHKLRGIYPLSESLDEMA